MGKKEIIDVNKLIAKFMGGKECDGGYVKRPSEMDAFKFGKKTYSSSELSYHKQWDWLMPVIDKIESKGFDTVIDFRYNPYSKRKDKMFHWCQIGKDKTADDLYGSGETKILSTYKAVIKFVKWYNKQRD